MECLDYEGLVFPTVCVVGLPALSTQKESLNVVYPLGLRYTTKSRHDS